MHTRLHRPWTLSAAVRRGRRPRLVGAIAAAALAITGLAACSGGANAVDQQAGGQFRYVQSNSKGSLIPAAKRKLAGDITGTLLTGGKYDLAAARGSVVLVNFFATWCGPCQTETPQLDALYRQLKAGGTQFVGIDVKDGGQENSRQWIANKQVTFPIVYDEPAKSALELGNLPIIGLPDTVLIDKQGRVAAVYAGQVLPADVSPALKTLIGEAA